MSSTRHRRCRFIIGIFLFFIFCGLMLIFQNTQHQLRDIRQQHLRCSQQQETLNSRLESVLEKKFLIENNLEAERQEHRLTQEEAKKAKEENENHYKADLETNIKFDRMKQSLKFLQSEHSDLVEECLNSKKQQSEQINGLEKKVLSLRSELQKEKNINTKEITAWTEKYNIIIQEKKNLEKLIKTMDLKSLHSKITALKEIADEYELKCPHVKPSVGKENFEILESNDFINSLNAAVNISQQVNKTVSEVKSNKTQSTIYNILTSTMVSENAKNNTNQNTIINKTYTNPTFNNQSLIINSVENFQMVPKSIKNNFEESKAVFNSKSKYNVKISPLSSPFKHLNHENHTTIKSIQEENMGLINETIHQNSISFTKNQNEKLNSSEKEIRQTSYKQLPLGVAPIPDNLDGILKLDQTNQSNKIDEKTSDNNRYANVLMRKVYKRDNIVDENSIDIKEQNLNEQHREDDFFNPNLIDINNKEHADFEIPHKKDESNENEKAQRRRLVENENLNNEVVGDQGKEFIDGLRLEDGNDEDEDEDDYSNPVVRQKEDLAIRN